jgi:hypothetical protein
MKLTQPTGALVAGLSLLAASACSSHHPGAVSHPGHYGDYARGHDAAYARGYHDGVKAGVKDWKRDKRFDPWRHGRYRSADSGYRSRYGPRVDYRRAYRAGFRTGYDLGYAPPRDWRYRGSRRTRPRW